jgi:hypothetical protein
MTTEAQNFSKYPKSIKSFVRDYIDKRIEAVEDNPDLIETGRITLSTCFYEIRPLLLKAGIKFAKSTRKTIQNEYVKDVCEKKGYKRADLGIIAAVRAEFYFKGELHSVGIDTVSDLVDSGTDVVIIEKEGVVEALGPYADRYGIALMYTRGFATEYAKELSEETGANIALVTDFDPAGIMIGEDLLEIERIGIDFATLEYLFDLEPDTLVADSELVQRLQEIYTQAKPDDHLVALEKRDHPALDYFMPDPDREERRRIEMDSVLKEVGNERFFDFIIYSLKELFPTRDYNRTIDVEEVANIYTDEMFELQRLVIDMVKGVLQKSIDKTKEELSSFRGFIENVEKYEYNMRLGFEKKRDRNKTLTELANDVKELIKRYSPPATTDAMTALRTKIFHTFKGVAA